MNDNSLQPIATSPTVAISVLTVLALLGFLGVSRFANRFHEQEKALARHLYQQGLTEQQQGKPNLAIDHFRAALGYDRDNFQYQLSLARALRDSGRTEEAKTYLISLWERSPQSGPVNLALGRLAARTGSLDHVIQYYHNAVYGVWSSDAEQNRLNAWFELIETLLRQNARPQAQAELISLSANLPFQSEFQLRAADLFASAQDYDHALAGYHRVLQRERTNPAALAGAGEASFRLARYRTAAHYLEAATKADAQGPQIAQMLATSRVILQDDPFSRGISLEERNRRIRTVFDALGERLETCSSSQESGSSQAHSEADSLSSLKARWTQMKMELARLGHRGQSGLPDELMDLALQIEQQTAACPSTARDQALLLLAQNRAGVEQ